MATDHSNLDEYIPDDGFEHWSMNLDCPCVPRVEFIPAIGGGLIHRFMGFADTFPEAWLENTDPPVGEQ